MADLAAVISDCCSILRPPPLLSMSEWADTTIWLSADISSESGKFTCKNFQRGIFDAFSDPAVREVAVKSCTQVGKTLFILTAIGYIIVNDPGPIGVVYPKEDAAKQFSKEKLDPFINATPVLRDRVKPATWRSQDNTIDYKKFPGGFVACMGALSSMNLASRPLRYVICDEVDEYEESAGTSGDPVDLIRKRVATYEKQQREKILQVCSPKNARTSRIDRAFLASDQRRYWIPCTKCGVYQLAKWQNVRWDSDGTPQKRAASAHYLCEHCQAQWDDNMRWISCENGEWRAEKPFNKRAGFHFNEICSPWRSLESIVADYFAKKDHPNKLKTFVNTTLAECWEQPGEKMEWEVVYGRREDYKFASPPQIPHSEAVIPARATLLTCQVDVQNDWLEYEVCAWGPQRERWSIAASKIKFVDYDSTDRRSLLTSSDLYWEALDEVLATEWRHELGGTLPIMLMGIDCGFRSDKVFEFCLRHTPPAYGPAGFYVGAPRSVLPIRGAPTESLKLVATVTSEDAARKNHGLRIVSIGTAVAKQMVYDSLRKTRAGSDGKPGYFHFPMYGEEWFRGLCAEHRVEHSNGRVTWEKDFERNEPLDLVGYSEALYEICGGHVMTAEEFASLLPATVEVDDAPPVAAKPNSWLGKRWGSERRTWLS